MKNKLVALWKDESAQGITEYILLLVIVVAIVALFKDRILGVIKGKIGGLEGNINNINP